MQRLISLIEGNLHFIVRVEMTKEQAIKLRQIFSIPLGGLARQYNLTPRLPPGRIHHAEKRLDSRSE